MGKAWTEEFEAINRHYRTINPENHDYGTHGRLLGVAGLMVGGGAVLELGAGLHSTQLLHNITQRAGGSLTTAEVLSTHFDAKTSTGTYRSCAALLNHLTFFLVVFHPIII